MNVNYLFLNARDELYRIDISSIVYFEADGNYTNIMQCNGQKGVVGMNLAAMQTVLSARLRENATIFVRIGKRFIINLNYVYHIEIVRQRLTLSDGRTFAYQLAISKEALKSLRDMCIMSVTAAHKAAATKTETSNTTL